MVYHVFDVRFAYFLKSKAGHKKVCMCVVDTFLETMIIQNIFHNHDFYTSTSTQRTEVQQLPSKDATWIGVYLSVMTKCTLGWMIHGPSILRVSCNFTVLRGALT